MEVENILFSPSLLIWEFPELTLTLLIGVISLIAAYLKYKKGNSKNKPKSNESYGNINNSTSITNNPVINISNSIDLEKERKSETKAANLNVEALKATTQILFIDDNHSEYRIISILKNSGWSRTKSIKDVTDLDAQIIIDSDIIFVDVNGVGVKLFFHDQGLGLASALKEKYPLKKVVIYSAESTGDRFHKALKVVDHSLPKNAEPYEFINLVESFLK